MRENVIDRSIDVHRNPSKIVCETFSEHFLRAKFKLWSARADICLPDSITVETSDTTHNIVTLVTMAIVNMPAA